MTLEDIKQIKKEMDDVRQQVWETKVKPSMIKRMKTLRITKIEYRMGVPFFTLQDGNTYADDDFIAMTAPKKEFYDIYIDPWHEYGYPIDYDVDLTEK